MGYLKRIKDANQILLAAAIFPSIYGRFMTETHETENKIKRLQVITSMSYDELREYYKTHGHSWDDMIYLASSFGRLPD